MIEAPRISAVVFERWQLNYIFSLCCSLLPLRNAGAIAWNITIFLTTPMAFRVFLDCFCFSRVSVLNGEWWPRYSVHLQHACFRSNHFYLPSSQYRIYSVNKYMRRQMEEHKICKQNNGIAFLCFICCTCFYFPPPNLLGFLGGGLFFLSLIQAFALPFLETLGSI